MMLHKELGRERIAEIRTEVEHNRLESRLSKGVASPGPMLGTTQDE